jgi:hypothetical protein
VNVEEIASRLERLLDEERAAIRALDGPFLEKAADEKESLAGALKASPQEQLRENVPQLKRLSASLRRNAILLAHARDSVRDVLTAARTTRVSRTV